MDSSDLPPSLYLRHIRDDLAGLLGITYEQAAEIKSFTIEKATVTVAFNDGDGRVVSVALPIRG
jgi:hypothetical protein